MPDIALARTDHDFVLRETPRGRAKTSRAQPETAPRFALLSRLTRRPGRTLLFGGAAVLLGGVFVNAMFLQTERHPAPFFRGQIEAAQQAKVPLPPERPAETAARASAKPAAAQTAAADGRSTQAREPAKDAQRETARDTSAAKHDPIAALLREGKPNAPVPPGSIPNPSADQSKRIVAVQEALKKLGHNVKPDGVAGPGTRAAIEAFERAQKLPVSGQMSPRVLKELAARSGVRIQ